jgi:hypothetical protein
MGTVHQELIERSAGGQNKLIGVDSSNNSGVEIFKMRKQNSSFGGD